MIKSKHCHWVDGYSLYVTTKPLNMAREKIDHSRQSCSWDFCDLRKIFSLFLWFIISVVTRHKLLQTQGVLVEDPTGCLFQQSLAWDLFRRIKVERLGVEKKKMILLALYLWFGTSRSWESIPLFLLIASFSLVGNHYEWFGICTILVKTILTTYN